MWPGIQKNILFIVLFISFAGCRIAGIHLSPENPKKPGTYPRFTEAQKLLGGHTPARTCFDVTFYHLRIRLIPEKKLLSGTVDIYAQGLQEADSIQLDLFKNMLVDTLLVDGKNGHYSRREGSLFVAMPGGVRQGERFKITIRYHGKPVIAPKPPWDGGFVWKKDKNGNPWTGVACETEGASLWWPVKDDTADEADSVALDITVPSGLVGVGNGQLRDSLPAENGMTTYKWFASYPVNTYNITVYAGNFQLLKDTFQSVSGNPVALNYYVLPYHEAKARTHFAQVKDILSVHEKYFGEYPWQRDGFKLIESPYEGMEHQSAIAYGNGYKDNFLGFRMDYIILHESAHEWWGNSITAADLADVWLQEGFATYAEALYVEEKFGKEHYLSYLLFYRLTIGNKRPVSGPEGVRFFDYRDSDVYTKGAWILHTLRTVINNDTLFFDILKSFAEKYRGKLVSSHNFTAHVNAKTGKDFTPFFRQYLYDRRVPFFEYNLCDDGKFYYRWASCNQDFSMPVYMKFVKKSDNATAAEQKVDLVPTAAVQSFSWQAYDFNLLSFPTSLYYFGTRKNPELK